MGNENAKEALRDYLETVQGDSEAIALSYLGVERRVVCAYRTAIVSYIGASKTAKFWPTASPASSRDAANSSSMLTDARSSSSSPGSNALRYSCAAASARDDVLLLSNVDGTFSVYTLSDQTELATFGRHSKLAKRNENDSAENDDRNDDRNADDDEDGDDDDKSWRKVASPDALDAGAKEFVDRGARKLTILDDGSRFLAVRERCVELWSLDTAPQPSLLACFERCDDDDDDTETQKTANVSSPSVAAYDERRDRVVVGYEDGAVVAYSLGADDGKARVEGCCVGHLRAVSLLYVVPDEVDLLVTASLDGTLRLWHCDLFAEVAGYSVSATVAHYDRLRAMLFVGCVDGSVTVLKLQRSGIGAATDAGMATFCTSKPFFAGPVQALAYDSETDSLVLASSASKAQLRMWPDVTKIAHSASENRRLSSPPSSPQASSSSSSQASSSLPSAQTAALTDDDCAKLLSALSGDTQAAPNVDAMERYAKTKMLLPMSLALADDDSEEKRRQLREQFNGVERALRAELASSYSLDAKRRARMLNTNADILQPADVEQRKRLGHDEAQRAMLERHVRELESLQRAYDDDVAKFRHALPSLRRQLATEYARSRRALAGREREADARAADALKRALLAAHPVVAERYQIGALIVPDASSVHRGIDLASMQPVAIKQMPSIVELNTKLSHAQLVPVLDVARTEGTNFVVMKMMRANLLHARHDDERFRAPDEHTVARLAHKLLQCLAYLHSKRLAFRDLRPSAVLLDDDGEPALVHLGVMRALTGREPAEDNGLFAPPEVLLRKVHSTTDVWSVGCLFAWLLQTEEERAALPLFAGADQRASLVKMAHIVDAPTTADLESIEAHFQLDQQACALLAAVKPSAIAATPPDKPLAQRCAAISAEALELLSHMLVFNPLRRYTAAQCLDSSYFLQFNDVQSPLSLASDASSSSSSQSEMSGVSLD
jgi:male germ cell-associated kinase